MTPHRHWFKSYTHFRTPVRLANNTIIFSAGVGSVVFEPVVDGKQVRAVEFSHVLHVPDLRSNLLSCLYLTCNKGFTIFISSHTMAFRQDKLTLFTASIDSSNSAVLNGSTVASETAFSVSTLPADLSLWYRRFTHHNYDWITFIDDSTRLRAAYLLKTKSQAFEAFKEYKADKTRAVVAGMES